MPSSGPIKVYWPRAIRFIAKETGQIAFGQPVDAEQDVGLATFEGKEVKAYEIATKSLLDVAANVTDKVLTVDHLLCPLTVEEAGCIRCIGLNYRKHAEEAGAKIPEQPVLFLKPPHALAGPHPDPLWVPKASVDIDQVDYESELAVIIGKVAKDVSEAEAMDYVLGYATSNDVSFRKWQNGVHSQWCFGKGPDKACLVGPCIVSAASIPDPSKLTITGTRNGKVVQKSGIDDLIFSVPKLISWLSQGTTLPAGTIIQTGTPSGIGLVSGNLLQKGDDMRVHVDGGCGTLINIVTHESA